MMLYIAPEIVKLGLARRDIHPERDEANPGGLTRDPNAARGTYSPTGAWGDPTLATVDKGRIVAEALVSHIVDFPGAIRSPRLRSDAAAVTVSGLGRSRPSSRWWRAPMTCCAARSLKRPPEVLR
jgi:hypothetical protein